MNDAPDDVQVSASFWRVSDDPRFPSDLRGETVATINAFFGGSVDDGKDVLRPIEEFGRPIVVDFASWRYAAWQ